MKSIRGLRAAFVACAAAGALGMATPAMAQNVDRDVNTRSDYADTDNDMDWGWLGLLGLAGLFGLRRRHDEPTTPYQRQGI